MQSVAQKSTEAPFLNAKGCATRRHLALHWKASHNRQGLVPPPNTATTQAAAVPEGADPVQRLDTLSTIELLATPSNTNLSLRRDRGVNTNLFGPTQEQVARCPPMYLANVTGNSL